MVTESNEHWRCFTRVSGNERTTAPREASYDHGSIRTSGVSLFCVGPFKVQTPTVMAAGTVAAPLIIPIIPLQTHRAKNHIDTSTRVSIQSDTPAVLIFYTVDGSKPVAAQRGSACSSRKYSEPVLLPAGRVSVRAVAVSSDGRQSSTVTKVFSVDSNDTDILQNQNQRPSEGTTGSPESPAGSSLRPPELRTLGNRSPPSAPRFLKRRLGPQPGSHQPALNAPRTPPLSCQSAGVSEQLSSTDASRVQHETDFMRCAQCLSLRPADPFSRFCAQCGAAVPPLPEQRLPPAEGGQAVLCVFCKTVVPVNAETCLVCEASVHQQLQPQASRTLQDHVVCVCCGSGNPAHVSSCLTCETRLQTQGGGLPPPPVPSADRRMLSCSRCKRLNHSDARFCDWCGSKPGHAARCVVCRRCGASGNPHASYCAACGVHLEAPAPPTSRSDIIRPVGTSAPKQVSPSTEDRATQTVGLYFPSATELHRKQQKEQLRQQVTRDRQPLLTAISPGRGFWRKQLDHVCAHLRSFAQNNPPFRTVLGEPRLGRVVSAVIQEDQFEASLTVSFVSAGREGRQVGPECAGLAETLSSVTETSGEGSSTRSDRSTRLLKPLQPKAAVKDSQLLKELGPGRGQISIIQQLLDQGANPSCCNSDGRHALVVAVGNGHHDVLPVLVQRGANVDHQSGPMKNTALHEAAALGSEGLQCAQVLLSCKASVRCRNAAGQSPYDMAVNSGCSDMVSLLAAQTGLDLLGKLGKPKVNLDIF